MYAIRSFTAAAIAVLAFSATPALAQEPERDVPADVQARDADMFDPPGKTPLDSGRESHERMTHSDRPDRIDVRSGESIESAKEEAGLEEE